MQHPGVPTENSAVLKSPFGNKRGQTLVEYALILVILVAIVIAAMILLKGQPDSAISKVVNSLQTAQ